MSPDIHREVQPQWARGIGWFKARDRFRGSFVYSPIPYSAIYG